jgi:branched-chain amino acid transport system permease protein
VLYVWWQGQIAPGDVYIGQTINLLVMAVIGGMLRIEGAWVGALAFIAIDTYVRDVHIPGLALGGTLFGGSFNTIIGVIFLAIVVISPNGLMGLWERLRACSWRATRGAGGSCARRLEGRDADNGSVFPVINGLQSLLHVLSR